MWHYIEKGQGRPLVLLHGIGMSSKAWAPVMPLLARERRVIAFDTAGFGQSPTLPAGVAPTTHNLVRQLARELRTLGINEPVDIAGNSLGGWMALEAARLGLARSVVAISPAGLWHRPSARAKYIFFGLRQIAGKAPGLVKRSLRYALLRELFMAVPLSTGGRDIPAELAFELTMDFVNAKGFVDTFHHADRFSGGKTIQIPLTIAFGTHDWLLLKPEQRRDELPDHVRWMEPAGWGHVPMWKAPDAVAELILQGIA